MINQRTLLDISICFVNAVLTLGRNWKFSYRLSFDANSTFTILESLVTKAPSGLKEQSGAHGIQFHIMLWIKAKTNSLPPLSCNTRHHIL